MQRVLPGLWAFTRCLWLPSFCWAEESAWNLSLRHGEKAHSEPLFPRLPGPDSLLGREIQSPTFRKVGGLRSGTLTPSLGSGFLPAPRGVLFRPALGPSLQFLACIPLTLSFLKRSMTFPSQASLCSVTLRVHPQEQLPACPISVYASTVKSALGQLQGLKSLISNNSN